MVFIKKETTDFDLINNEYPVISETVELILLLVKDNKIVNEICFFMNDGRRYSLKGFNGEVIFKKYRTVVKYQDKICILKNSDISSIDVKFASL